MLTRIRIEVSGEDSAAACEAALAKYEHALQMVEVSRHRIGVYDGSKPPAEDWSTPVVERDFYNSQLGREVTDEVIEYDPSLPGYKGRRVVCFRRIDTRSEALQGTSASAASSSSVVIKHPPESVPVTS